MIPKKYKEPWDSERPERRLAFKGPQGLVFVPCRTCRVWHIHCPGDLITARAVHYRYESWCQDSWYFLDLVSDVEFNREEWAARETNSKKCVNYPGLPGTMFRITREYWAWQRNREEEAA